jgi:hypothetical protein
VANFGTAATASTAQTAGSTYSIISSRRAAGRAWTSGPAKAAPVLSRRRTGSTSANLAKEVDGPEALTAEALLRTPLGQDIDDFGHAEALRLVWAGALDQAVQVEAGRRELRHVRLVEQRLGRRVRVLLVPLRDAAVRFRYLPAALARCCLLGGKPLIELPGFELDALQ